jgi:hypothetical protein
LIGKSLSFEVWKRSRGVGDSSDEDGHVGLIEFASGNGQHHLGKVFLGSIKVKSVQSEKDEGRHCTDALVSIDEGMVFHRVEQVGRGHLVDVCVKELRAISGRRHSNGGLEHLNVPDAGSAPISGCLVLVNRQHLGQAEEGRFHMVKNQTFYDFIIFEKENWSCVNH